MIKRIGIIGAGAIGCVVGGLLTKAGHDVTLIDQWPEHVEAMQAQRACGCPAPAASTSIPVKALHMHELQRVDRAVRRGVRRGEVLRHRVGDRARRCRTWPSPTASSSTSRTASTTSAWPRWRAASARSAASSPSAPACTSPATPCAPTPATSASRSASTTARDTPRARELAADHERGGAPPRSRPTSGASAGRSSPSTAWRTRSPASAASARPRSGPSPEPRARRDPAGAPRRSRVGPRARPRGRADLRHRRPALRRRRRGRGTRPSCSSRHGGRRPGALAAAGRRCCRT